MIYEFQITMYIDEIYDVFMERFSPQHTIWRVSQLSAYHTVISVVPEVITDGAPTAIDTHLHSTIKY